MTLDDDDDDIASGLSTGSAGSSVRAAPVVEDTPPAPTHIARPPDVLDQEQVPFRVDQPYVAMSETSLVPPDVRKDSLTERVGPVLLIVTPLLAAMVGAMNMLGRVSDFSSGSWYAVGTVFVVILLGTLFGGLLCSWVLYLVRLRSNLLLRFVFALAAAGIAYSGVIHLPNHLVVRENDFPGVVLPEGWHLGR